MIVVVVLFALIWVEVCFVLLVLCWCVVAARGLSCCVAARHVESFWFGWVCGFVYVVCCVVLWFGCWRVVVWCLRLLCFVVLCVCGV